MKRSPRHPYLVGTLAPRKPLGLAPDEEGNRFSRMTVTKLDLSGLKCPLPALKTRKALGAVRSRDYLEVHCTDPLSAIDIPNLVAETGDSLEKTSREGDRIIFLIQRQAD